MVVGLMSEEALVIVFFGGVDEGERPLFSFMLPPDELLDRLALAVVVRVVVVLGLVLVVICIGLDG